MTLTGPQFWFTTFTGLALLTILAFPVAALAVWIQARRRGTRRPLAEVAIIWWTVPLLWMTMLPNSGAVPRRVSLVPFRDLVTMSLPQIVGNLAMFAALGFFAPIRFATLASLRRILLLAAACSATVEVLQYVLELNRVSSVDDVLLNTAGAGLAALASYRWWLRPTFRGDMKNRIREGNAARS
ncbi:VanZ family protein [Kribbella sp. NPDC004536]|uniref:VanZ family protein n=1 Tax=Kribbella sp. NPDC004536 TaxID=3364106 RepID=UPI0036B15627